MLNWGPIPETMILLVPFTVCREQIFIIGTFSCLQLLAPYHATSILVPLHVHKDYLVKNGLKLTKKLVLCP